MKKLNKYSMHLIHIYSRLNLAKLIDSFLDSHVIIILSVDNIVNLYTTLIVLCNNKT